MIKILHIFVIFFFLFKKFYVHLLNYDIFVNYVSKNKEA
jgi:hypothetical protein